MARALFQKLGIKESSVIGVINPPSDFEDFFLDVPFKLEWKSIEKGIDFIHFFPKDINDLERRLPDLQNLIQSNGMIWVSWFKKASKIPTDLNENIIRNTALSLNLVDVKVCSISDHYSALKLVIRKHLR